MPLIPALRKLRQVNFGFKAPELHSSERPSKRKVKQKEKPLKSKTPHQKKLLEKHTQE